MYRKKGAKFCIFFCCFFEFVCFSVYEDSEYTELYLLKTGISFVYCISFCYNIFKKWPWRRDNLRGERECEKDRRGIEQVSLIKKDFWKGHFVNYIRILWVIYGNVYVYKSLIKPWQLLFYIYTVYIIVEERKMSKCPLIKKYQCRWIVGDYEYGWFHFKIRLLWGSFFNFLPNWLYLLWSKVSKFLSVNIT